MASKMIKCKSCGADIAANAKACPQCGAKNKKPIYKQWWLYVIVVLVIIAIAGGSGGSGSKSNTSSSSTSTASASSSNSTKSTPEPIEYTSYEVTVLFDALKSNAMKAQNTYKGQYVELHGYLSNIDSDGKYISLGADPENYDYMFESVHCSIKNDEQKEVIMDLNKDDPIVVRGKITDVGEVLGYYLDIDSIQ